MLTALQIANFKAFADLQRIPIRPLTLIYGVNSAGKSSILHSLILARHALETGGLDVHRTQVGGDAVDLGGFRQYVHRREANRRIELSAEFAAGDFTGSIAELLAPVSNITLSIHIGVLLDDEDRPLADATPETHAFAIEGDGRSILRMSRRKDGRLQLDRLDHHHPVFREALRAIVELSTTATDLRSSDYEALDQVMSEIVPEMTAEADSFIPRGLARTDSFAAGEQLMLFAVSKGRRQEDLAGAIRLYFPRKIDLLISGIAEALSSELSRLQYLGPLRSYPPRHVAFSQFHDPNWQSGGGYAWDVLRQDPKIRDKVNYWLGEGNHLATPYELLVRNLLTIDTVEPSYTELIGNLEERFTSEEGYDGDLFGEIYAALKELKKQEAQLSDISDLYLVDRRNGTPVSHRDVGIGISQVMPVLVAAFASRDKIHVIEQPEIHLHPALQAELGDLFIESALGDQRNRFLIETHSEHLLLRVMRRMRETAAGKLPAKIPPVRPQDVMVLYVEPDGAKSIVREMPLNERGELVKAWPGGFFEEGLREVF